MDRRYSAGSPIDDLCRACKTERRHTVQVVDDGGRPLRVVCDYCGSTHNYRGGGSPARPAPARREPDSAPGSAGGTFSIVSERERRFPAMSDEGVGERGIDLESLLRQVIREESGLTPVRPAERWHGGELVLRPGKEGLQDKTVPIETFFHKIVMVRNRLRVLEQQINSMDIPDAEKVRLQAYITGCYGSLTTFNVLFAEEDDRFKSR
jgi:hypothetical protein